MSNYDDMSNNFNQSFASMSMGQDNPNHPRYVPPQKRPLTFGSMPPIERPESAMSNESFVSQAIGGVSLNTLLGQSNGQITPARETFAVGGGYGAQRGYTGEYGQGQGQGTAMGGGRQQRRQSTLGNGGDGGFAAPGGFSNGQDGRGGYGAGPQGNYTFGQTAMPNPQAQTFLKQNAANGLPTFGAIGTTSRSHGGYPGMPTQVPSPDSANDSVRGGGNRQAFDLANLIRSGAADPGEDEVNDPLTGGRGAARGRGKTTHQSSNPHPMGPMGPPMHRPTRSTANGELDPSYKAAVVVVRENNIQGNSAAFQAVEPQSVPDFFAHLQRGIKPTVEEFFFNMPVIEPCRIAVASNAGVVRIRNIPFTTPRSEITAFVGRNAQIVSQPPGSPYFAVHVIMERHTGKTMDAFIEFSRSGEAQYVVSQFNKRMLTGRHPRLGDRHVEVEISSQEDLMGEMFPRAKNVVWEGATPRILANNEMYYANTPSAGFTGFLQTEEIVMMIKHAETPHRSPFAQRAIIRVYESHISTLHKYPWFAHECVNMTERRLLFDATMSIAKSLIILLRKAHAQPQQNDVAKPTAPTLQELTVATLTCPGFSEAQKATYIQQLVSGGFGGFASSRGMNLKFGGVSALSAQWPFQVLARNPGSHEDLVFYFASLMREATMGAQPMSLIDQHRLRASGGSASGPFGHITFDYSQAKTLVEVAEIELRTIEALLSRVLPRSRANSDA
ncbi:hypothetical protein LTR10_012805 [Elasticomyces elasticus]|nr:hypothetical protein LTR10_012805 [Elasticomyces elasticus]KAK4978773.1 hypothetical protein LTR42_001273 [Elasticomyces elasticus]